MWQWMHADAPTKAEKPQMLSESCPLTGLLKPSAFWSEQRKNTAYRIRTVISLTLSRSKFRFNSILACENVPG